MRRIWWLASYPKSGNTWLRALLSAYLTGKADINRLSATTGDVHPYWYQVCSPQPLASLSTIEALAVRQSALLHMEMNGGDPLLVKTHCANAVVDRYPLLPPALTAGAIYIVRDPRDVAVSWSEHLGKPIDETINDMADSQFGIKSDDNLPHVLGNWSEHVRSYLSEDAFRVSVVRYEDLVDDTEKRFTRIVERLGLDLDCQKVTQAVETASFGRLARQESESGFRERRNQERFFARGTYGGWRKALTAAQSARIESDHGDMMRHFHYLDNEAKAA